MTPSKTAAKKRRAKKTPTVPEPKLDPKAPQLRTSERSTFKRCRWQWARTYGDRRKPRLEKPALRFGTLIHAALEERYPPGIKRGPKPAETFERLYNAAADEWEQEHGVQMWDADGEREEMLDLGVSMMEGFVREYGRDEDWQVISSERTFSVPVFAICPQTALTGHHPDGCQRCGDSGKVHAFTYVGTMDGVWRNRMDGKVRVIDWKTTSSDPTKQQHLILDEQATAYWTWGVEALAAEGVLKTKDLTALDGMLYTFLYKQKTDERPVNAQGLALNKDGTVSGRQPVPRFHRELVYRGEADREKARARVLNEVRDMFAGRRDPERHVYKTPGGAGSMNHCGWCPVRDLCELDEMGKEYEELAAATFEPWDPYADHEIETEGR